MRRAAALALLLLTLPVAASAQAPDRTEPAPDELKDVGITEHLGDSLPLDATFTDQDGNVVKLDDLFHRDRPVVLSLIYFNCPQLCSLVLNGMVASLQEVGLKPGDDYDLITVSFDPNETTELASLKRKAYLAQFNRPGAEQAWTFLTGDQQNIHRVTDAVGFSYKWVESRKEFAHAAAIFVITPEGQISRYLYGVMFDAKTLRLSLVEASGGEIGTTADHFVLTCFVYDPVSGSYAASAMAMIRWGGIAAMVFVVILISVTIWIGKRRRAAKSAGPAMA